MTVSTKTINWDYILESYGYETKIALIKLMNDAQIEEDDPAAVVLAGLFISQIDTNQAFANLSQFIDQSKADFSEEFKNQIIQLRGIISFAQEHLVEAGKEQISNRQDQLLDTVKRGIAKAIGDQNRGNSVRNARFFFGAIAATLGVCLIGLFAGVSIVSSGRPQDTSYATKLSPDNQALIEWANTEQGKMWIDIVNLNFGRLDTCIENQNKLDNKCIIKLP